MFKTKLLYQDDERWKNVKLGNSPETIGIWGGLLTSVTMMLNGIGYLETPETVNEKLKEDEAFLRALLIPSYVPYLWPNCVYLGMVRCEKMSPPIERIDAAIAAGKPVILQVDSKAETGIQTHFVLVKEKKRNDYVLYDPIRYDGDGPGHEVLLTKRYTHNGGKLEAEISAVLWFDFRDPKFPRPPQVINVPVPAGSYTLYVAVDGVALRAEPSTKGYPRKLMVRGTELKSLEPMDPDKAKPGKKGQWIQVQDPKGVQGYVAAEFVTTRNFLALVSLRHDVLPERKKWCLKNVVIENPQFQTWNVDGSTSNHTPDKSFHKLLRNTVVNVLKSNETIPGDDESLSRSAIAYQKTHYDRIEKKWVTTRVTGWLKDADLDDYQEDEREEFRKFVVKIHNQTENSTDAQQYLYIKDEKGNNRARYNMCGELCVAFVTGQDIEAVLSKWQNHDEHGALYEKMVGKADKPLRRRDMQALFDVHEIDFEGYKFDREGNPLPSHIPLADIDTDSERPNLHRADQRRASAAFQDRLQTDYFITTLKIDTNTGDLKPALSDDERNHWIVVERVTRNGERVELYNPFPNKRQEYTFGEFYKALRGDPNTGWWIKKTTNPTVARQKAMQAAAKDGNRDLHGEKAFQAPIFQVAIDSATLETTDAEQYMKLDGSRKTNLCGEFCVSFVLTQSAENTFKRWRTAQESPRNQDEPAQDLSQFVTWLKGYGFINGITKPDQGAKLKRFSIDAVLSYWKAVQPELYNSILGGGNNEKTGPAELKTILRVYGYRDRVDFHDGGLLASPSRTAEKLKTHFFISGVLINANKGGRLGGNIPHWIVVDKITPIGNMVGGNGGWVELYNPFLNRREEYSYREFIDAYNGGGLWVARDIERSFERQFREAPKRKGNEAQPNSGKNGKGKKSDKPARTQKELMQKSLQRLTAGESPKAVARFLAKQLDLSVEEANRLLGFAPAEESFSLDVEGLMCERLAVEAVPVDVMRWIRDQAKGDVLLAEQLIDLLVDLEILNIDAENKICNRTNLDDQSISNKIKSALQKGMDPSDRASLQTASIAEAIVPTLALRVMDGLKSVQAKMAEEELKTKEAQFVRKFSPQPGVPAPGYRVLWDWEREDFPGHIWRPNLPAVFRCGQINNSNIGHYVPLTKEWQFFWFDLCSYIYYGKYHEQLTAKELEWLGSRWTSVGATTTAFTNDHGLDRFRNDVLGKRPKAGDPKIYTLVCGGASLAGTPVEFRKGKKRMWMLKVAHFDGNRPPPPVERIDPYSDPRVFFATTIRNKKIRGHYCIKVFDAEDPSKLVVKEFKQGFSINRFPQFHKDGELLDCPVPLVACEDIYFPMKFLAPITTGAKVHPYFP